MNLQRVSYIFRITLNNPDVAQILWDRIKDYLKPIEFTETKDPKSQHIHGIPFLLKGKWEPCGLNNVSMNVFISLPIL